MLTGSEEKSREKEHLVNITLKLVMLIDELESKQYIIDLKKAMPTDEHLKAYHTLLIKGNFLKRQDIASHLRESGFSIKSQDLLEGKGGIISTLKNAGYIYKSPMTARGKRTHKIEYLVSYPYPHNEDVEPYLQGQAARRQQKINEVWAKHKAILPVLSTKEQTLRLLKGYLSPPQPIAPEQSLVYIPEPVFNILDHRKDKTLRKIKDKSSKELKELIPLLLDSIGFNLDIDDLMILLSLELKQKIKDKEAMRKWKQKALRT